MCTCASRISFFRFPPVLLLDGLCSRWKGLGALEEVLWTPQVRIVFVHPEDANREKTYTSKLWVRLYLLEKGSIENPSSMVGGWIKSHQSQTALELPVQCQHLKTTHPKGWWLQAERETVKKPHKQERPCKESWSLLARARPQQLGAFWAPWPDLTVACAGRHGCGHCISLGSLASRAGLGRAACGHVSWLS